MAKLEGFKEIRSRFNKLTKEHVLNILTDTCFDLINNALDSKEYTGFTGNTQTSYTCGIYLNGKLTYILSAGNKPKKPVSKKVKKGNRKFLYNPYEGDSRSVYGEVDTNNLYGQPTAINFLKSYKDAPKKGFAIVMTTGTEYSVYLEKVLDLTVLGTTYLRAKNILMNRVRPID